ncbi:putative transcription factor interactor and regulator CCHC(Zn) family [Helianthus annuus]|nr:putative transcription factor interactor and regulator CCHC(Zn) family [Helianthus annuus]KAJ0584356.1 putative transcription factor interactor and regulator CCHC(Zn) family [Helianthus annuus]
MLLKNCPHHGIQMWELLNAFHEGLLPKDTRDLSSMLNGTFGTNYEHLDWDYLEKMTSTSKRKAQSSRRGRHMMVRVMENTPEVGKLMPMCGHCGDQGHIANQCPSIMGRYDEVSMMQGNGNRYLGFQGSNQTFHPRNQANYPGGNNFGYQRSYQQGNGQDNNEIMEMLKAMQQEMQNMN